MHTQIRNEAHQLITMCTKYTSSKIRLHRCQSNDASFYGQQIFYRIWHFLPTSHWVTGSITDTYW